MQNDHPSKPSRKTQRWPAQSIRFVEHKGKKAGYRFPLKSHEEHEVSYVDYGRMKLILGESTRILSTGECVVIPPGTHHSTQSHEDRPFSFLNIMYRGRCPAGLAKKRLVLSSEERQLMADLKQESESRAPYHNDMLLLKLNLLLLSLARNHRKQLVNIPVAGSNRMTHNQQVASRALAWLEGHLQDPLDPDTVAQHAGVSTSHLRKLIKQETGKSLSQHLKTLRVELAKQLLMESPLNMNELAWRVGYTSAPHFCTVFKNETGKTATEFAHSLGQPTA
ncbi:MAG: AraC family transcriptional regulator [Verrucomicrobiota bacterium]